MEIKIEIDEKELKNKIIKFYGQKLYEDKFENNANWTSLFGVKGNIKDAVHEEAMKYLMNNPKVKEKIKALLTDDKFLKEAVKEALSDMTNNIMQELKNE